MFPLRKGPSGPTALPAVLDVLSRLGGAPFVISDGDPEADVASFPLAPAGTYIVLAQVRIVGTAAPSVLLFRLRDGAGVLGFSNQPLTGSGSDPSSPVIVGVFTSTAAGIKTTALISGAGASATVMNLALSLVRIR